jgi:hypothetical protein
MRLKTRALGTAANQIGQTNAPIKLSQLALSRVGGRLKSAYHGFWCRAVGLIPGNSRANVFSAIYRRNLWNGRESRSGRASSLGHTARIREALPKLIHKYGIQTMVDVPCGDFHWMRELNPQQLVSEYWGFDIVTELAKQNQERFGCAAIHFGALDIVTTIPPAADLILCRHLLIHLPLQDCLKVIHNFKRSGSRYLLITNDADVLKNNEIAFTGSYSPRNLTIPPFNFPNGLDMIPDSLDGSSSCPLTLYRLTDVPVDLTL